MNEKQKPLAYGDIIPPFKLPGIDNEPVSLADVRGAQGTVLLFVRGTWCSFCVSQTLRLNRLLPRLQALDIGVACVAHDPPALVFAFVESLSHPLQLTMLADGEPALARAYGIYNDVYQRPIPSIFYADANDVVRFVDSNDEDRAFDMDGLVAVIENGVVEPALYAQ